MSHRCFRGTRRRTAALRLGAGCWPSTAGRCCVSSDALYTFYTHQQIVRLYCAHKPCCFIVDINCTRERAYAQHTGRRLGPEPGAGRDPGPAWHPFGSCFAAPRPRNCPRRHRRPPPRLPRPATPSRRCRLSLHWPGQPSWRPCLVHSGRQAIGGGGHGGAGCG